jgi:hypothetical protein
LSRNDPSVLQASSLRERFTYNKRTGILRHRKGKKRGRRAGSPQKRGNRSVGFKGGVYQEHIVIWIMVTGSRPEAEIDHKNRNRADNRWKNLRPATRQQQMANTSKPGAVMKGAHRNHTKKFRARICVNYKSISLGYHDTAEAAHAAYMTAARKYFGEYANAD